MKKKGKKPILSLRLRALVNDRDKEKVQEPPMATPVVTCGVKKTDRSGCSSPLTSQLENSLPQVTCYFPCPFPNEDAWGRSLLLPWLLEKLPHQHSHIHLKTFSTVTHYWTGLLRNRQHLKVIDEKEKLCLLMLVTLVTFSCFVPPASVHRNGGSVLCMTHFWASAAGISTCVFGLCLMNFTMKETDIA